MPEVDSYTSDHILEIYKELCDPTTTEDRAEELERILTERLSGYDMAEREPGED